MTQLAAGDRAPEFALPDQNGRTVTLGDLCASTTSNAGVPESKEFSFIDASEQVSGSGRCRSMRRKRSRSSEHAGSGGLGN